MKLLDQLLTLCMNIYDVVSSDSKVYMMSFGVNKEYIDESIGCLSMITCSFILKSGMKPQDLANDVWLKMPT